MKTAQLLAIFTFFIMHTPANAGPDSIELAMRLGSVMGSEKACGLSFDKAAIERYIDAKIPATDMDFPSSLNLFTSGTMREIQKMSDSSKAAHCAQIRRIAKSYDFTK